MHLPVALVLGCLALESRSAFTSKSPDAKGEPKKRAREGDGGVNGTVKILFHGRRFAFLVSLGKHRRQIAFSSARVYEQGEDAIKKITKPKVFQRFVFLECE
jgi:hypothetical protein